MKVIVFTLLALVATAYAAPPHGDDDDNPLVDLISGLFSLIKGVIPPDSELQWSDLSYEIPDNDVITGKIAANQISITGLQDFAYTVKEEEGKETHIDYDAILSAVSFLFDITIDIEVAGVQLASDIVVSIGLEDLDLAGDVETNDDATEVSEFDALITLKASKIDVTGVVDEDYSAQLSSELTEKVPQVVNEITLALEEPVSAIVKYALNLILKILS